MRSAAGYVRRSGIAPDPGSIYTALADWRTGADLGGPVWDEAVAAEARELLNRLEKALPAVRDVTEDGIRELTDLFVAETELCLRAGHSRPEEGTEHFLAYCLEDLTKRLYVHGELVCLCIVVMATLQGNAPDCAARMIHEAGVRAHPVQIGLPEADLVRAVADVSDYVRAEGLFPSGVTQASVDEPTARRVVAEAISLLTDSQRAP
jgi:glycerol-1-phosphate dehydrogenase [NAD(P)+]